MKLDKRYIKFYETGNNKYYLLPFSDELHVVTESIMPIQKKFLFISAVLAKSMPVLLK